MDVNMHGALLCVRACSEAMAKRAGGAIVNQSLDGRVDGIGFYGIAKLR
jgi:NAD(P)-dependent dehydrogenase (short-subunit alcohol dehydrogenase family)